MRSNKKKYRRHKIQKWKIEKYINTKEERINKNNINKKDYITYLTLIIIILTISLITSMITIPNIKFKNKDLKIRYNTKYNLKDIEAKNLFSDYTKKIKIEDNININKLGTYEVLYKLKFGFINIYKKRIIEVIDDVKPEIILQGNEEETICPNDKYEEPGYKAIDGYEGDITDRVKRNINKDEIIYKVEDSTGNKNIKIRKIKYEDITPPEITLRGTEYITIYEGNNYIEPGYTAKDNCDGDITNKVEVSGTVNTNKEGIYKITYKVHDSYNNEITKIRTIEVKKWAIIRPSGGGVGKGIVYLTFDDGPNEGTTNVILDILKEEKIQATFFVTCNGPDYLIKRMYDEGHTVALHTATHNYSLVYSSLDNYFNDLNRVSNRVERITGIKSQIIRFPGGSSNTISKKISSGIMTTLTNEVKKRGYHYFDWNVDSGDAAGANTNAIYQNVVNNISLNRENVVLMHDIKYTTTKAVKNIIQYGKQNGYTFKKITYDTTMITHGVNN